MNRKEFEAANERLGDCLKRIAPDLRWYGDCGRLFDGYQYQWMGVRKGRAEKSFHTFSWSWDGIVDEVYLAEKITRGKCNGYLLSNNLTRDVRGKSGEPWQRIEEEQWTLRERSRSWRFFTDVVGGLGGAVITSLIFATIIGLPIMMLTFVLRLFW